jgi:hypothetical protein
MSTEPDFVLLDGKITTLDRANRRCPKVERLSIKLNRWLRCR